MFENLSSAGGEAWLHTANQISSSLCFPVILERGEKRELVNGRL